MQGVLQEPQESELVVWEDRGAEENSKFCAKEIVRELGMNRGFGLSAEEYL
jgi:hypothetical protein